MTCILDLVAYVCKPMTVRCCARTTRCPGAAVSAGCTEGHTTGRCLG